MNERLSELRNQILALAAEYVELRHATHPFDPNSSQVAVSGKVVGTREVETLIDASLDCWLTTDRFNHAFQKALSRFLGIRHVLTVNSGSSANLVAVSALTSHLLGERALKPGDEVITCATGFPTTVNPILQNRLVPVFVDVSIPTYNIDVDAVRAALTDKTRAIVVAHTLGNPFDLTAIKRICDDNNLWLVEDNCDALGSTYHGKLTGTFGDIGTLSFYPAHHITMGEGGAVFTANSRLNRVMMSIRDWGRDCYCDPGEDNTCKKRFDWQLGNLPFGYDHKYTYSHLGFNLKISDMQAAVGLAQLTRLEGFIADRKRNFARLHQHLSTLEHHFILPKATPGSDPSWFGFPLTVRHQATFSRDSLVKHLNDQRIATRLLFGGNLTHQPYMKGQDYRVAGSLANADKIMNNTFWIGVYPGLNDDAIDYMASQIKAFIGVT